MLCYAILYYVLCYAMLCYAILYYVMTYLYVYLYALFDVTAVAWHLHQIVGSAQSCRFATVLQTNNTTIRGICSSYYV